jgi:hypothetical protein
MMWLQIKAWLGLWLGHQKASLERIEYNIRAVFSFFPMAIVEVIINIFLFIILIPFVFSRALDTFIGRAFILYRNANDERVAKIFSRYKSIPHRTKAEKYATEFSLKEAKFIGDFISKLSPFIFGVLTTLVTLYFSRII